MTTAPLVSTVEVPIGAAESFALLTEGFTRWWPPEFSWSGPELLAEIGVEPGVGGTLYEIGPHGLRWDWGRVVRWEPPHTLAFTWQIGPDRVPVADPDLASRVEIGLAAIGGGTAVTVKHGGWDHHGRHAVAYREAFAQTWPTALARLRDAASAGLS